MTRWRLVPSEPTEAMVETGGRAHDAMDNCSGGEREGCGRCDDPTYAGCRALARAAYDAMIAAAPDPSADEELVERVADVLAQLPVRDGQDPAGELDKLRRSEAARAVLSLLTGAE